MYRVWYVIRGDGVPTPVDFETREEVDEWIRRAMESGIYYIIGIQKVGAS